MEFCFFFFLSFLSPYRLCIRQNPIQSKGTHFATWLSDQQFFFKGSRIYYDIKRRISTYGFQT